MDPDLWEIQLRDGSLLEVLTHGYSVQGRYCVFSLLFQGNPNFEMTSLKLPMSLLPEDFH